MKLFVEGFGANSIDLDTTRSILSPDTKRANAMMFYSGTAGTTPAHWNNSPFLAGGRLTSAFGANPKKSTKREVLSYHDFLKTQKQFSK
jgi:hypothetical protein